MVYLYATDRTAQYSYSRGAEEKGYNVLLLDGQLDQHLIQMLESKLGKTRFVRVDSDTPERLIRKQDEKNADVSPLQADLLTGIFRSQIPAIDNTNFIVEYNSLSAGDAPATVTQNEMMRRMKEMAAMQQGMNFYGQMPDMYALVVNTEQPVVKKVLADAVEALETEVGPLRAKVDSDNSEIEKLRKEMDSKKEESEKKELRDKISEIEKEVGDTRSSEEKLIADYASEQPVVKQIIDLALLQSNLLRGEALAAFIRRSVSLL